MQGCIPFLLEGGGNASYCYAASGIISISRFFYSIHVPVAACGKAKRKRIYPTGVFSIVPMDEKPLDMIKSITDFHRFEKIYYLEPY